MMQSGSASNGSLQIAPHVHLHAGPGQASCSLPPLTAARLVCSGHHTRSTPPLLSCVCVSLVNNRTATQLMVNASFHILPELPTHLIHHTSYLRPSTWTRGLES